MSSGKLPNESHASNISFAKKSIKPICKKSTRGKRKNRAKGNQITVKRGKKLRANGSRNRKSQKRAEAETGSGRIKDDGLPAGDDSDQKLGGRNERRSEAFEWLLVRESSKDGSCKCKSTHKETND